MSGASNGAHSYPVCVNDKNLRNIEQLVEDFSQNDIMNIRWLFMEDVKKLL